MGVECRHPNSEIRTRKRSPGKLTTDGYCIRQPDLWSVPPPSKSNSCERNARGPHDRILPRLQPPLINTPLQHGGLSRVTPTPTGMVERAGLAPRLVVHPLGCPEQPNTLQARNPMSHKRQTENRCNRSHTPTPHKHPQT